MNKLIEAYKEYIELLNNEIESMVIIARIHGWQSENVEAGKKCRKKIAKLEKLYELAELVRKA